MSEDPLDRILESVGVDKPKSDEQTVAEVLNNAEKLEPPKYPDKWSRRTIILILIGLSLILIQLTRAFVFQTHQVVGNSIQPTLHEGDRLIISKLTKKWNTVRGRNYLPKYGTIIAFTDPQDKKLQLVKRVIGLPGDQVIIKNGQVTVYNQRMPDGFVPGEGAWAKDLEPTSGDLELTVPEGKIFVLGDNRPGAYSLDSRTFGPIPSESIIGQVTLRIWPFSDRTKF